MKRPNMTPREHELEAIWWYVKFFAIATGIGLILHTIQELIR